MAENTTVAVIGLEYTKLTYKGPAGLVALKNLRDEGFSVTGFDRNSYIGGLWQYSANDHTSVLQTTMVNISKERACFTDYPFPEDIPSHPTAAQVQEYLIGYMKHFNLEPYIRLNTCIKQITFDEQGQKWVVGFGGEKQEFFDKVVVAIGGMVGRANMPNIDGIEKFAGSSVHSQAFKRPKDYKGKKVMVVGFSNSAADTATQLVGVAEQVYLAHRHGTRILPRRIKGVPVDHTHSIRILTIQSLISRFFPRLSEKFFDTIVKRMQNKSFNIRPEWRFEPPGNIIVSDTLVPCLEKGSIKSVAGVKRILSRTEVELQDGTRIDVDAIVWCTGYQTDFSIIDPDFDPTCRPEAWLQAAGSNNKSLFSLYYNIFSLKKPDSLAFLGNVLTAVSGFQLFDMASMAITQVWAGKSQLPSVPDMRTAVQDHHDWLTKLAQCRYNVSPGQYDAGKWVKAMDDLAGTGVNEYLGYGWKGWLFWIKERKFCNLLMDGIWSPHIHRVFDVGKRNKNTKDAKHQSRAGSQRHAANFPAPTPRDTRNTTIEAIRASGSTKETRNNGMATKTQTLHGSCACGRNRYVIEIPAQLAQLAELRYDNTSASRHHSANPLTLWFRVPLPWYTSATFAQFPDETQLSIKRSFVSPFTSHTRRQFCGYCGTQLSSWNERTQDEAEHISLTVGSLLDEDQELLGELGYLPSSSESSDDDDESTAAGPSRLNPPRTTVARPGPQQRGAPWFEEIVRNTRLGRFKQQRGGHTESGVHIEWEVTEWTEGDADDEGSATPSKRKIGDIDDGEDTGMRT
ncbi:dimethylaniline monooxygenase 2 [Pyrenophora seminiperda CCB06]|uniref:Dimethylaniline monooxygenase 2 n=1 Tax=Pyrenophora seminiperda CCB06 TaxID=1302712 RepID=A0A3M7LYQ8_9PLEO|nr:dimethylaniline monooxygenase 2 [Pyrenophora seminiperda CCB06]